MEHKSQESASYFVAQRVPKHPPRSPRSTSRFCHRTSFSAFTVHLAGALAVAALFCSDSLAPKLYAQAQDSFTVQGQGSGQTPFHAVVYADYTGTIQSVSFTITPQPSSRTRPLHATYSGSYLQQHGWINNSAIWVPIFGLYSNFSNTVSMHVVFADGGSVDTQLAIVTGQYVPGTCPAQPNASNFEQNRTSTSDLPFDYFLLKSYCNNHGPFIMDTDGSIRWEAVNSAMFPASIFNQNAIYATDGASGINKIWLETGYSSVLADFKSHGVVSTFQHNIDYGPNGRMIVETDNYTRYGQINSAVPLEAFEAGAIEFDVNGTVTNQWDFANIVGTATSKQGGDPSKFIVLQPTETSGGNAYNWFHANATAYNPRDNTLLVSSREMGVIDVDYDQTPDGSTRKINWILGDTRKAWGAYLDPFALTIAASGRNPVEANSQFAPIGQHGISFDSSGNLLLMNDGLGSIFEAPTYSRGFSFVMSYSLDPQTHQATPTYSYYPLSLINSSICGSAYEFSGAHLVDFAQEEVAGGSQILTDIRGLGVNNNEVFKLTIPTSKGGCAEGWNAVPLDMSNLTF